MVNKKEEILMSKRKEKEIVKKDLGGKKKKNIIARHKLLFLICFLAFIVVAIMLYVFFNLFVGGNDPYGDRLKGIKSVEVSKKEMKEVASKLKENDSVVSSNVRTQGKIIYIHIKVKGDVSLDVAKGLANESLGNFSDKEKKYYDFGYFLSQDKEDGFVVTGTKNSNSDNIVWIKS